MEVILEDENDENGPASDVDATNDDAHQEDEGTFDVEGNCVMYMTPFKQYKEGMAELHTLPPPFDIPQISMVS